MAHSNSAKTAEKSSKFDPYDHFHISLNDDGSLTRFSQLPTSPAISEENARLCGQAVVSKDIILDAEKDFYLRIFRPTKIPSNDSSIAKLPVLLYFHTGGFITFSVNHNVIHENCNLYAAEIPAIVIGVNYRLAPEHRLPAAYDDAVTAIKWLQTQASTEKGDSWIRDYADVSRTFLYGASAGGNIVYHAALRILDMDLQPLTIVGTIMNQPLFGGKTRAKSELKMATDTFFPLPAIDLLWELALPKGTDRDHRFCNPLNDAPSKAKARRLCRTLVIGFGGDPLIDRQQAFVRMLVFEGVRVEARFDDVGFHCIDLIDSRWANAILGFIKEFI